MTYSLEMLYKLMSPIGLQMGVSDPGVKPVSLQEKIQDLIMDPRGVIHTYSYIHEQIKNEFSKQKSADKKSEFKNEFHIFGPEQPGAVNFGDADYYDYDVSTDDGKHFKTVKLNGMSDMIHLPKDKYPDFSASAFVVRSPYVSPATRGVEAISYFVGNTPSIVASQMIPYLSVEFELIRSQKSNQIGFISTPTLMRFLLGSIPVTKETMSGVDTSIETSGIFRSKEGTTSYSGLEMFLAPQTLTNMDNDGVYSVVGKTVKQKPFVPFASIEGFDVSAANAGAGKFAHRKASLKLKIHDKARLAEMSEFLRPQGYHNALIWTTYGWLAPTNRGDEDEYSKFINENMLIKECWSVVNSNFSFDGSGQVSLTLELLTRGARAMQGMYVTGAADSIKNKTEIFDRNVKTIGEFLKSTSNNPRFALSALATQVLNQGASTGIFTDIDSKQLETAMNDIFKNAQKANINPQDLEKLRKALVDLRGTYSYDSINKSIRMSVANKLNGFGNRQIPDPFLPSDKKVAGKYVDANVVGLIKQFSKTVEQRKQALADERKKASGNKEAEKKLQSIIQIDDAATVVSFGKFFLSFVVPEVHAARQCEELQVFFYALNDQCGPMSGYSIAEFPIDVQTFAYAYAEAINASRSDHLTVETFLKLLIETQFTDQRAIGYGMYRFFKPFDRDKANTAEQVDSKNKTGKGKGPSEAEVAEAGLNEWFRTYGSFRTPMIEMVVESGEVTITEAGEVSTAGAIDLTRSALTDKVVTNSPRPPQKKIVKRIHIYDKQNNPHRLLQSIISAGEGSFEIGEVDKAKVQAASQDLTKSLSAKSQDALEQLLKQGTSFIDALEKIGIPKDMSNSIFDVIKRPGKDKAEIKTTAKNVKDQIAKIYPTITVGTNGTLITSANASSKSDGLQGAINIQRSHKGFSSGKPTVSEDGLQDSNGLPMTIVPMSLSMTSVGIPTLQLYQSFYIDLGTGTSIDNVYICNSIQHNIAPGKFTTNMSFIYSNAYPKFSNPPSHNAIVSGQMLHDLEQIQVKRQEDEKKKKGGAASK